MIDYPKKLNKLFDKLNKFNVKPIIVGGYIRDTLLNIDSKDIDIELYGLDSLAQLEEILSEFGSLNHVGRSFGVCKLSYKGLDIDFSLPRTDSKVSSGHQGFNVTTYKELDFNTAAQRRDFTINAMGYDIASQKLLDPYNGLNDLNNSLLKAVNLHKFAEDPLRILRAVQFSARFHLILDSQLLQKCKQMVGNAVLHELANERIFIEMQKLLLKAKEPSIGIKLLQDMGAFSYFKELELLSQEELLHLYDALDRLSTFKSLNETVKMRLMLAVLCSALNTENVESFLLRLTAKKELIKSVLSLHTQKNFSLSLHYTDETVYKLASSVNIALFCFYLRSIYNTTYSLEIEALHSKAQELYVLRTRVQEIIQGKDLITLGLKPSKEFSSILKEAYSAQMRGEFTNKTDALSWLKKTLIIS